MLQWNKSHARKMRCRDRPDMTNDHWLLSPFMMADSVMVTGNGVPSFRTTLCARPTLILFRDSTPKGQGGQSCGCVNPAQRVVLHIKSNRKRKEGKQNVVFQPWERVERLLSDVMNYVVIGAPVQQRPRAHTSPRCILQSR